MKERLQNEFLTDVLRTKAWWNVANAFDFFPHGDSRHYWYTILSKYHESGNTIIYFKVRERPELQLSYTRAHSKGLSKIML